MTDMIDRQKLLDALFAERSKENACKCSAFRHKHYEEGNMYNHGLQTINKIILLVRGMEAEHGGEGQGNS